MSSSENAAIFSRFLDGSRLLFSQQDVTRSHHGAQQAVTSLDDIGAIDRELTELVLLNNYQLENISQLATQTGLVTIKIQHSIVKSVDVFQHARFAQLVRLNLSHNQITIGADTVLQTPNLRRLNLSHNKIECMGFLRQLQGLERLDLSVNRITDVAEMRSLQALKQLRKLKLCLNPIVYDQEYLNVLGINLRYCYQIERIYTFTPQEDDVQFLSQIKLRQEIMEIQTRQEAVAVREQIDGVVGEPSLQHDDRLELSEAQMRQLVSSVRIQQIINRSRQQQEEIARLLNDEPVREQPPSDRHATQSQNDTNMTLQNPSMIESVGREGASVRQDDYGQRLSQKLEQKFSQLEPDGLEQELQESIARAEQLISQQNSEHLQRSVYAPAEETTQTVKNYQSHVMNQMEEYETNLQLLEELGRLSIENGLYQLYSRMGIEQMDQKLLNEILLLQIERERHYGHLNTISGTAEAAHANNSAMEVYAVPEDVGKPETSADQDGGTAPHQEAAEKDQLGSNYFSQFEAIRQETEECSVQTELYTGERWTQTEPFSEDQETLHAMKRHITYLKMAIFTIREQTRSCAKEEVLVETQRKIAEGITQAQQQWLQKRSAQFEAVMAELEAERARRSAVEAERERLQAAGEEDEQILAGVLRTLESGVEIVTRGRGRADKRDLEEIVGSLLAQLRQREWARARETAALQLALARRTVGTLTVTLVAAVLLGIRIFGRLAGLPVP